MSTVEVKAFYTTRCAGWRRLDLIQLGHLSAYLAEICTQIVQIVLLLPVGHAS